MRLRKVQLKGFKSFAGRVTLQLTSGLTCIVGPNGCGKSNIVDAIRWVMGEQSAKSIRGDKMRDVLFAGAENQSASDAAEVVLTFVDVGEALPLEFETIEIARTLTRKGESSYRLNGKAARLKDIQSLFWDSGLGKDAFAIFEQGKVDQIIQINPQERRAIFEEAAGILRFRRRKREALAKLEQTEINLSRLSDLLGERQKQMDHLEQQVQRTENFHLLSDQLVALEKGQLVRRFLRAEERRQKTSEELAQIHEKLERTEAAKEETGEALFAAREALKTSQKNLRAQSDALYEARKTRELKALQQSADRRRKEELEQRAAQVQGELEALQRRLEGDQKGAESAQQQLAQIEKRIQEAHSDWQSAKSAAASAAESSESLGQRQRASGQERVELVQRKAEAAGKLQETCLRLETSTQRLAALEAERTALTEALEASKQLIATQEKQLHSLSSSADAKRTELQKLDGRLAAVTGELELGQKELSELSQSLAEARARRDALLQLKDEMADCSQATQALLKAARRKASPLYGLLKPLYEEATCSAEQSRAYAAVMRPYAQTLLAKNDEALARIWQHAEEKGLHDFSITSPALLKVANHSAKSFLQHIPLVQQFRPVTLVRAESLESVFQDGAFLDHRGVLFRPAKGEGNAFMREAELKALELRLVREQKRSDSLSQGLAQLRRACDALRQEGRDLDRSQRQVEMRVVEANFSLQQARTQRQREAERQDCLEQECKDVALTVKQFEGALGGLEGLLRQVEEALTSHRKRDDALNRECQEKVARLKELEAKERGAESTYRQHLAEKRRLEDACHVALRRQREGILRQEQLGREAESLQVRAEEIQQQLASAFSEDQESSSAVQEAQRLCELLEREVGMNGHAEQCRERELAKLVQRRERLQQEAQSRELLIAQQGAIAEAVVDEARERYQEPMETLHRGADVSSLSHAEAEGEIKALRKKRELLGAVNLSALDEYDSRREAHESLEAQVRDLEESKGELTGLIGQLDRSSRRRFKQTFARIRKNFSQQFQMLFDGGEADLVVTDAKDVLDAGVEIVARPPGKQMRSINLLSGGEKCLTAMALLFAIFQEKPAPFAVLDEMDAPLDDENVKRFLRVLESFKEQTQFLVITHNKLTMAAAGQLFGVTMEKKGISRVVYLSFERESQAAAAGTV